MFLWSNNIEIGCFNGVFLQMYYRITTVSHSGFHRIYLSYCLAISFNMSLFVYISVCLCSRLSISIYLSICLSLSVFMNICLSLPSFHSSTYISLTLSLLPFLPPLSPLPSLILSLTHSVSVTVCGRPPLTG